MHYRELQRQFEWLNTEIDGDGRILADAEIANEDLDDELDQEMDQETENIMICDLLRMTNSLRVELIPSATNIEMKAFNWTI